MECNANKYDQGKAIDEDDFSIPTSKARKIKEDETPSRGDISGEINMEAEITADDIMHAGGIGARDDINSILPIASDFTDVEEHLHDVEGYEDLKNEEVQLRHLQPQKDPESETSKNTVKDTAGVGEEDASLSTEEARETVNMEASVTSDEVMRAGGFGAKDDISSFLPVATDFTDFEANLRGARDYEDSDEKIDRHGLGWNSKSE